VRVPPVRHRPPILHTAGVASGLRLGHPSLVLRLRALQAPIVVAETLEQVRGDLDVVKGVLTASCCSSGHRA
jgi:hypothetical protein